MSALLLVTATLFTIIGTQARASRAAHAGNWLALGALHLVMSLDEFAGFHEAAGRLLGRFAGPEQLSFHMWIVLAVPILLVLGWWFSRFIRDLPADTRRGLLLGWAVYLGGAVGMEIVGAATAWETSHRSVPYVAVVHVEEALEMLGLILLVHALMRHLARHVSALQLRIDEA